MATIAILRQLAPTTGGVRHPCIFCESKGYTKIEETEQRDIFELMSEIQDLRQENCKREEKLCKLNEEIKKVAEMNHEMDDFFDNVVLGPVMPVAKEQSTQTENVKELKLVKKKRIWRRKEREIAKDLEYLRVKMNENSTPKEQSRKIPAEMWGHKTRRWVKGQPTLRSVPAPPLPFPSIKSWRKSSKTNPYKSYSIPFRPKPLHLLVKKAYLKPPPRLPPPAHSKPIQTIAPTARLPECASAGCEDLNIVVRELFADALERAINSTEQPTVYVEESWANHPYYEEEDKPALEGETVETVYDLEESWADHPYYDDLDASVTVREVDEIQESDDNAHDEGEDDTVHDEIQESEDNAHQEEDEPDNELWEDHPYYDIPDELEDCEAESDDDAACQDSDDDAACQDCDDAACQDSEEEEVAWEDSPYY